MYAISDIYSSIKNNRNQTPVMNLQSMPTSYCLARLICERALSFGIPLASGIIRSKLDS